MPEESTTQPIGLAGKLVAIKGILSGWRLDEKRAVIKMGTRLKLYKTFATTPVV